MHATFYKIGCFILVFSLLFNVFSTASAAQTKKEALEEKYGLSISMEQGDLGKDYLLESIDTVFSHFPTGLIKEMTDYYKIRGIKTVIKLTYRDDIFWEGTFGIVNKTALMNLYLNSNYDFESILAHESGHFLHEYLKVKYGAANLQREWIALNEGKSYKGNNWRDATPENLSVFSRDYGTMSYSEDFATVIEELAGNPEGLRIRLFHEPNTPFAKKIVYLNRVLEQATRSVTPATKVWERAIPQNPSPWARSIYKSALDKGIIPQNESMQYHGLLSSDRYRGLFTSSITREDFCGLIANLIEVETTMTLSDFTKSKGKNNNWYANRYINLKGEEVVEGTNYPFTDTEFFEVFDLYALGVIGGTGNGKFDPTGKITREQAAAILYNLAQVLGRDTTSMKQEYADLQAVSPWAKESVNYVSTIGIMNGTGNNKFSPKSYYTYEQTYATLVRFLESK
ncbi:S-layer homology domain-containing protein [uncultured Brevibacillus sp.]|uniref:S-layer homology domain-containing protein n=1 Tax=uncultured Brevibacillus sp. TaxID=169970 RepID=UPI00259AC553|nr:S-layer homology domain-containing protein [uncultured Brevibacillus sp.]